MNKPTIGKVYNFIPGKSGTTVCTGCGADISFEMTGAKLLCTGVDEAQNYYNVLSRVTCPGCKKPAATYQCTNETVIEIDNVVLI